MLLNKLPTWPNCSRYLRKIASLAIWLGVCLSVILVGTSANAQIKPLNGQDRELTLPVSISALPGFADDDLEGLDAAIEGQCKLKTPPATWLSLCKDFLTERGNLKSWISERFQAWPLLNAKGNPDGLITGYYEPIITGSRIRDRESQVALYKRPADLVRNRAAAPTENSTPTLYYSRAEIENFSLLAGQELIWVDDAVDAFFLQIQGSGRVELREPNGTATVSSTSTIRVGYADHNGHPYKAIGQVLIEKGVFKLSEISAEGIKKWLRDNPLEAKSVMQTNPRFIFFTELPEGRKDLGPVGALAVPLTKERSIASDPKVVPLGTLVFLDTSVPANGQPLQKVVISQDVGAAISGAVRADYFWGTGSQAERSASAMKQPGRLWILWPIGSVPPNFGPALN
jgi:membrane-bound lytic murein transglycosylase A